MITLVRNRRFVPAILLTLLGIALGATLLSTDSSDSNTASTETSGPPQPIEAVEREQRDAFGLLRGNPENLPSGVVDMLSPPEHGLNLDLAQRIDASDAGQPAWVIPGRDWICLFLEEDGGGSAACDTTEGAVSNGVNLVLAAPAEPGEPSTILRTIGIVPEGVAAVRFEGNESGPDVVAVEDNAYYLQGGSATAPRLVPVGG